MQLYKCWITVHCSSAFLSSSKWIVTHDNKRMACPRDSAFASQLPLLDLTEMNTLLQLSYVAQQCLYTGEAQPQEPK